MLLASGNALFGWLTIVIDEVLTASLPDRILIGRYRSAATDPIRACTGADPRRRIRPSGP